LFIIVVSNESLFRVVASAPTELWEVRFKLIYQFKVSILNYYSFLNCERINF